MKDEYVLVISSNRNFGVLASELLAEAGFDFDRISSADSYFEAENRMKRLEGKAIVLTEPFIFDTQRGHVCVSPLIERALKLGHTPILLRGYATDNLSLPLRLLTEEGLPSILQSSTLMDAKSFYEELAKCQID